jgi:hypothetical protein
MNDGMVKNDKRKGSKCETREDNILDKRKIIALQ